MSREPRNKEDRYLNSDFLRKQLDLQNRSQVDVCRALDWGEQMLQKYLKWESLISYDRLQQLGNLLGLPASSLAKKPNKKMKRQHEQFLAPKRIREKSNRDASSLSHDEATEMSSAKDIVLNNQINILIQATNNLSNQIQNNTATLSDLIQRIDKLQENQNKQQNFVVNKLKSQEQELKSLKNSNRQMSFHY